MLSKFIKKTALICGFMAGLVLLKPQPVQAYALETHFYETYTMLVMTGIEPAAAERLATYAQWVDVSQLNSAMNPIPIIHARVSRMMHFPTEGVAPLSYIANALSKFIKTEMSSHGNIDNIFSVARRNSIIANEIFNHALKTGNPYLIGAALHVLMDSYAHEGFNYVKGHGDRGHYPDRPWMFLEKHTEMRKKLFLAMTRVREVLPPAALSNLQVNDLGKLNRDMNAEELFKDYTSNPLIQQATASNPHRDPLYTGEAVGIIINKMIENKIATPELEKFVFNDLQYLFFEKQSDGLPRDGWAVVRAIVDELYKLDPQTRDQLLDREKVLKIYGNVSPEIRLKGSGGQTVTVTAEEVLQEVSQDEIKENMVYELCLRVIPKPALGDDDNGPGAKDTFEHETLNQNVEKPMQIGKWQSVLLRVFRLPPVELDETKIRTKIWAFLKRDVRDLFKDLDSMSTSSAMKVPVSIREQYGFLFTLFKYTILDYALYRVSYPFYKLGILERPFGNMRTSDDDALDAKFWQSDTLFKKLQESGVFKKIYNEQNFLKILNYWKTRDAKFAGTLEGLLKGDIADPVEVTAQKRTDFFGQFKRVSTPAYCRTLYR